MSHTLTLAVEYEPKNWQMIRIALACFMNSTKDWRESAEVSSPELSKRCCLTE